MQLFYAPQMSIATETHLIQKDLTNHILKVLRKKVGDTLFLTNGKGDCFEVVIQSIFGKKCTVQKINHTHHPTTKNTLHIAVAPTKSNDRMGFMVEKLTEIGVDEISFLRCHRSERKTINTTKMQKIAIAAMQQSLRFHLPKINDMVSMEDFLKGSSVPQKMMACCEVPIENSFQKMFTPQKSTVVLIGPEGDFTSQELTKTTENGFKTFSLGAVRYRTETAAMICGLLFQKG